MTLTSFSYDDVDHTSHSPFSPQNHDLPFLLSLISPTMLDHRQELAGNCHIFSSRSTYHAHSGHESGGDREFSFWCSSNTISFENACDQLEGRSVEDYGVCFPPSWESETYGGKSFKYEDSPLLPCSHHCCSLSPSSRSTAIAEGRRELMEMIQDMPESSYELSFQDMVEGKEQQVLQPGQNETFIDNTTHRSKEPRFRKQNKKKKNKSNRPNQILRMESMDSETFLLKMFFPISLDWMKKVKVGNGSKVSPRQSFQESVKHVGKEWRIKRLFPAADNRSDVKEGTSESTNSSCNKSNKSRYIDRNFPLGCWPFFLSTKTKKQGRCTF